MKIWILVGFATAQVAWAQSKVSFEKVVRYDEVVAGNSINVMILQRVYDFSKHQVAGGGSGVAGPATIDGVAVAGTDGASPKGISGWPRIETVAEIELKWNGKLVPVPKNLHLNLLRLSLREDTIQFVPRPSGEELLIQATGGDGGGSYLVSLVLRKNGKHKQYESGYHEEGLRPAPYLVEEIVGEDEEGRAIFESFQWLEPGAERKSGGGKRK